MREVEEIIQELLKFSDKILEINPPVQPEMVSEFEQKYDVKLPNDYKYLLNCTNGFSLMGTGVLGLYHEQNVNSLQEIYDIEHYQVNNPQPRYLVPFHNDGRGNFYCFDTRKESSHGDSCPVVFWQHDLDYSKAEPEIVNENLIEWIQEVAIDWTLEDYDYNGDEK